ncbi:MAG TPA: NAD-dependent epimerase/dehydratase family protein, partial [bacterium]|nr:NAD-dependent epimerase/dehydratase family protein [bacterium]
MYIITGGAGFIGSALVAKLNQNSITNIIIVDHLGNSEKWKNLRNLKFCDYLEKDDFLNLISAGKLKKSKIAALIHFGACSSTTETDCTYLVKNNYEYSKI